MSELQAQHVTSSGNIETWVAWLSFICLFVFWWLQLLFYTAEAEAAHNRAAGIWAISANCVFLWSNLERDSLLGVMLKHVSRRNRIVSWWGTASLCACSRVWGWMLFTWWGVSPKSMWLFMQWGANGHCWEGVVESALSSGHGSLHPRSSYGITMWFDKFQTIEIQRQRHDFF